MADIQGVVEQIKLKQQNGQPLTQDEQVLANLTPEQLQQVMRLNELQEKRDTLRGPSGKMGLGQSLIDQGMPDNGTVSLSSGTSFHRGNTKADYLADAIRKTAGAYLQRRGQARDERLMKKQTAARSVWADAALRQAQAGAAARTGAGQTPATPETASTYQLPQPGAPLATEPTLEERLRRYGMGQFGYQGVR